MKRYVVVVTTWGSMGRRLPHCCGVGVGLVERIPCVHLFSVATVHVNGGLGNLEDARNVRS